MVLLLTILSVIALWAFLTLLVIGLLVILKALEAVRRHFEQIAMGVRAIERETSPLGEHALTVRVNVQALTGALHALGESLDRLRRPMAAPAEGESLH